MLNMSDMVRLPLCVGIDEHKDCLRRNNKTIENNSYHCNDGYEACFLSMCGPVTSALRKIIGLIELK